MDDGNVSTSYPRSPLRLIASLLLIVVVPLAAGLYFAPRVIPTPKVGIVRLSYDIVDQTAFEITQQLAYARSDRAVKAVVLIINSPGGSAAYSEELFMALLDARDETPIVASIDLLAASGAYYMAAAADEIYAKPTSNVGSIGVIAFVPDQAPFIENELLTTGPYKAFGGTRDGTIRQIEMAKFSFLEAVKAGRGDRLQVDLSYLSRAEIYTGVQAMELGLIDGLSSNEEVISRAASLAGIANYEVVELFPLAFPELFPDDNAARLYRPPDVNLEALLALPLDMPADIYYRYYVEPLVNR